MSFSARARRRLLVAVAAAATSFAPATVRAQHPDASPERPKFEPDQPNQDSRDWTAYLDCALNADGKPRARACLYWAERLDPSRPEAPYASWMLSRGHDGGALKRALANDPFMIPARIEHGAQTRPGLLTSPDKYARSLLAAGDYYGSSRKFAEYLQDHPDDFEARWGDALALYYRGMFDSSAAELAKLEALMRAEREGRLTSTYRSLAELTYMQALAYVDGGRRPAARAAAQRALTEDATLYRAHMLLADLALADGDTVTARAEWSSVVDLYADDLVAHRRHAQFLARVGEPTEAEAMLRDVAAKEPEWIDLEYDLAVALEAQGDAKREAAAAAYTAFLTRAPAADSAGRRAARTRLAALRAR